MYTGVQKKLIADMNLTDSITHPGEKGAIGEALWIQILSQYLPDRYKVRSGIVLDHQGHHSDQIDVIIHDAHFTPYLLGHGRHIYVPAEAVYAVFEVKQKLSKEHMKYASKKLASVRKLKRTSIATINSGRPIPARAVFPVIGGLLARTAKSNPDSSLPDPEFNPQIENWENFQTTYATRIDCLVALDHGCCDLFEQVIDVSESTTRQGVKIKDSEFSDFSKPSIQVYPGDNGLIYFLLRLLYVLNKLGSCPAVDWTKYLTTLTTFEKKSRQ